MLSNTFPIRSMSLFPGAVEETQLSDVRMNRVGGKCTEKRKGNDSRTGANYALFGPPPAVIVTEVIQAV